MWKLVAEKLKVMSGPWVELCNALSRIAQVPYVEWLKVKSTIIYLGVGFLDLGVVWHRDEALNGVRPHPKSL